MLLTIFFGYKTHSKELHIDDLFRRQRHEKVDREQHEHEQPKAHIEVRIFLHQKVRPEDPLQASQHQNNAHVDDEPDETRLQQQVPNALLRNQLVRKQFAIPGQSTVLGCTFWMSTMMKVIHHDMI